MKCITTAALILGLALVSCKKEKTTDTTVTTDSVSYDTMNVTSDPVPNDSVTTMPMNGDSAMGNTDSAGTTGTTPAR